MSRVDEFDSFFRAGFQGVLQVTYAVCGDRQVALDATTDAFRRAWRDWSKIRDRSPLSYVRNEAWKATSLSRGTHPLRRRQEDDSDVALLDALGQLSVDQRRLLILMTLGNTDLEAASREVDIPAEDGIEMATDALARLEKTTGNSIAELEQRLHGLSSAIAELPIPEAATIRVAARRGTQRNTFALVALALIAMLGAGFVVTDNDALARQGSLPDRERLGAEGSDIVLDARKLSDDDLLSAAQLMPLETGTPWKVAGTDDDPENTTPYATCPTQRFADDDPLRVFVRSFTSSSGNARVAQSIEVSRSASRADASAEKLISWFADCSHPRVQLISTNRVQRPFGDFTILSLRSHRKPERTFTVGFAHSGSITSTVVHEIDGDQGPSVEAFAGVLNDSVSKVCRASGARCSDDFTVIEANPPRTSAAPSFLGVVDLPPIADVDRVWAAVEAKSDPNPAATPCDKADFTRKAVNKASSRIFVLYQATDLPREFGITETVARFESTKAAKDFVSDIAGTIDGCPDENLSAEIDQNRKVKADGASGQVWRVRVEVTNNSMATYRVGLIRRGRDVAQVTLVPAAKKYDISQKTFASVVERAGTRLVYAK